VLDTKFYSCNQYKAVRVAWCFKLRCTWSEHLKGRDRLEDVVVDGRVILLGISEKLSERCGLDSCEQVRVWRRASVTLSSTVGTYVISWTADRLLAYHVRSCPVELVARGKTTRH
jgi:hypothetical protein